MIVSVLIHNMNRAAKLRKCLVSVAEQQYRPLEVIILDAGSIDDSLSVIHEQSQVMRNRGIEVKTVKAPLLGVAASRNLAAQHAIGELLCVIDNDATFAGPENISELARMFAANAELAVVTARIVAGDSEEIDQSTWVYRRPQKVWSRREFPTFTFTGGGFCVRSRPFREAGGFWEHLQFSREEEELSLALIHNGWKLIYSPAFVVRHYPDPRNTTGLLKRRYLELRNGLLILWRRLPLPVAIIAINARIVTAALRIAVQERKLPKELLREVREAIREWRRSNLQRVPVSVGTVFRYACLHIPGFLMNCPSALPSPSADHP